MIYRTLGPPSKRLVNRILKDVDFHDRFLASRFHPQAGIKVFSLYNLKEVHGLLCNPYPQIDIVRLGHWIRSVVKDSELADRIRTIDTREAIMQEKLLRIRDIIGIRLAQCQQETMHSPV